MNIHFNPDLLDKVNRVAAENGSGADQYIQQLVEHYVDHDAWFREKVKKSLGQLDKGDFLTHEEVGKLIDQMFCS